MKKELLFWVALLCLPILTKAQNLEVLKRLDADRITTGNTLYLRKDGKIIRYYKTSANSDDENALNENDIIGLTTSNKMINLKMAFYNPLQYKLKVKSIYIDDPFVKSYEQFLAAISSSLNTVITPTTAETQTEIKSTKTASDAELTQGKFIKKTKTYNQSTVASSIRNTYNYYGVFENKIITFEIKPTVKTVLLSNWYYQLLKQTGYNADVDKSLAINTQTLENFLYSKITIGNEQKALNDWMKDETQKLYNITDYTLFKKEIERAKSIKDSLLNEYDNASDAKTALTNLIRNPTNMTVDHDFSSYSLNTIAEFELKVAPLLNEEKDKIDKFVSFIENLDKDISNLYSTDALGQKFGNLGNIAMKSNQDANITITFTKLSNDGNEVAEESTNLTFTVIKYSRGVVNFSTGFVLTNLNFPNYSVETDANNIMRVQQELPTKKRILPTVFLNFYSQLPFSDFYLILPQLGVSSGNEYPSLLLGGGLAIGNRFSLTGGAIMAFMKDLNNLHVGEIISSKSDLESDLAYKYNFKAYFSLSYRLGKK